MHVRNLLPSNGPCSQSLFSNGSTCYNMFCSFLLEITSRLKDGYNLPSMRLFHTLGSREGWKYRHDKVCLLRSFSSYSSPFTARSRNRIDIINILPALSLFSDYQILQNNSSIFSEVLVHFFSLSVDILRFFLKSQCINLFFLFLLHSLHSIIC
jgi:hypothetical protein